MLRYMLDTNICIYLLTGRAAGLAERFEQAAGEISISAVTLSELWFGVEKSARRDSNTDVLTAFVARLEILDFTADAAQHYGELRAHLKRAGTPVGFHDMMIGAHARAADLTLVTNNRREFDRLPGLRVENWV